MSAWGWHWHCPKCHQTITDLNKDAHLGTCSAPRSPSSSKPVNCPECGRFEGHVVTCTSWRPVRCAELSAKLGETGGRRGWAVQPQIDDLDARITALVERISRFEGRINDQGRRLDCLAHGTHTALVKRIEAVERQLPAGGRGGLSDQAQCSDGTTSIKPPPPLSQQELRRKYGLREGTQEQADIAAAARKATLKDVALLLRTMMRNKSEGGLNLDATDCVLLTAALDDYFGDKAGKDTP